MAEVVYLKARWTQQEWMAHGLCKGQTQHFFAPHGEQAEAREARESIARSICGSCSVLKECRDYAREHREQGFWGGENDDERTAARRRLGRSPRIAAQA